MAKTAKQVQTDVIRLLEGSDLASACSGSIYRNGQRPLDSELEDIIVIHTSGIPDQHQTGVVTIHVYVQDTTQIDNGVKRKVENSARTGKLEAIAAGWVDRLPSLTDVYFIELHETIVTGKSNERSEHFIVVKLHYELLNY